MAQEAADILYAVLKLLNSSVLLSLTLQCPVVIICPSYLNNLQCCVLYLWNLNGSHYKQR
jgi:hypothetical protein